MLKFISILCICLNLYSSSLLINPYCVTDEFNSYTVYDNDILFTNIDQLKFDIESDENITLFISYNHNGQNHHLESIDLKKNQQISYPKDNFLNFDEQGYVEIIFATKTKVLKKFNLMYIESKKTSKLITPTYKYGVDPNLVISNDRGIKEKEAYKKLIKSTVIVKTPNELGSGVLFSDNGQIITNYHVVKNESDIEIAFKPQSRYASNPLKNTFLKARLIKFDILKDLALLQLLDTKSSKFYEPIQLSKFDNIQEGSDVFTMGHPQGEYFTFGFGTISAIRENYQWNDHKARYVIQTQSATSKGNSGGPLLGEDYKLIGINSFSNTEGQNLNFAVSIVDIKEFIATKESQNLAIKVDNNFKNYTKLSFKHGLDTKNKPLTTYYLDGNKNGKVDLIAIDVGNNGFYNYLLFDTNEDGIFEKKAYDKDGDGVIERVVNY